MSAPTLAAPSAGFTAEQKQFLEGFLAGEIAARGLPFVGRDAAGRLTGEPASAAGGNLADPAAEAPEETVFGTPLSELSKPEKWKREQHGLDIWDKLVAHAATGKFPDEADTFRFKFFGLFYVAPTQNSFMLRIRVPAGELRAAQLRGLADLAELGNGGADITTRANLQFRELKPQTIVDVLTRLQDLGLTSRGAGADNVRNITATPTSGFDRSEIIDVRPYARALHHYILNHRDLFGLPRKFNIAFDSGGAISSAADTNDIGFFAVRVTPASLAKLGGAADGLAPGVYFRVQLGGITGHGDFARDTGLLLSADELVPVAAAMLHVFRENGDRTDRKKARLKYLLGKWGVEKFLAETERKLAFPLRRLAPEGCEARHPPVKHAHLGVGRQSQSHLNYIGVGVPVGRLSARQLRRIADVAEHYGQGEVRLTVWQNLLIPHVPDAYVGTVERALRSAGLFTDPGNTTGCLVACTGSKGCKYAAADTKGHAAAVAKHLAAQGLTTDFPVNIHLTGCPNSCAQHYCGDIGGVGVKLADGREGYHVVLGGGMGPEQGIAREIFRGVDAAELPALVAKILATYQQRHEPGETFVLWARRHSVGELQELFS
ncbi:MAG: NirA family protein [Opitutaceae bacterium]